MLWAATFNLETAIFTLNKQFSISQQKFYISGKQYQTYLKQKNPTAIAAGLI